jgi:hypothetical protein
VGIVLNKKRATLDTKNTRTRTSADFNSFDGLNTTITTEHIMQLVVYICFDARAINSPYIMLSL